MIDRLKSQPVEPQILIMGGFTGKNGAVQSYNHSFLLALLLVTNDHSAILHPFHITHLPLQTTRFS